MARRREELHQKYAPKVLERLVEVKGVWLKVAQFLYTSGVMPETYQKVKAYADRLDAVLSLLNARFCRSQEVQHCNIGMSVVDAVAPRKTLRGL